MTVLGRIAPVAMLLAAYASPGSAQTNNMSDVLEQLKTELNGEPVNIRQEGAITITSGADAMFPSGGWELAPGVPVLSKIVPTLAKLQHTWIVVGGYTDNTPITTLKEKGVNTNLELSCRRAGSVVAALVTQGVNPGLLSIQCFGPNHPVASNDTPEGQAKNRRVAIMLSGDGT